MGLSAIPFGWKVGLLGLGLLSCVLGIVAGINMLCERVADGREASVRLEYSTAANAQLVAAQKEILDGIQNLQAIEDEIYASPDADNGRCPAVVGRELDRLHAKRRNDSR